MKSEKLFSIFLNSYKVLSIIGLLLFLLCDLSGLGANKMFLDTVVRERNYISSSAYDGVIS